MIKAEVVFYGDCICIGDFEIYIKVDSCYVNNGETYEDSFDTLEQAIKYCMEQSQ